MGWVLFYDGSCGFCSATVRWVARFDKRARISFAPLQGELAGKHGFAHLAEEGEGTIALLRESDGEVFTRSDAAIEVARILGGAWRMLAALRLVPRCLRDGIYRWIARNRHRIMGRADACPLPDERMRKRMRE